ncbi:hypothetical protein ACWEFL_35375 [Streptomyces sp. NPDC004838]
MAAASAVHNLAALLASDCGLPDLARQWCHRQAHVYLRARPLGAQAARLALEPLVNLARLHIRDGDGDRAHHLIDALYTAVSTRTDTTIDGVEIPASNLTASPEAHKDVQRWLWATMLATSARALAVVGRWEEARMRLQQHNGIGNRMLDGRQVAVIASASAGDTSSALALLDATRSGATWENTVTACLKLLCRRHGPAIRELHKTYRKSDRSHDGLAVFHTRLGLTVIDAFGGLEDPYGHAAATDLIHQVENSRDGYAAQDLLSHAGCAEILSQSQALALRETVDACGFDSGSIPADLHEDLVDALSTATTVIARRADPDLNRRPSRQSHAGLSPRSGRPVL